MDTDLSMSGGRSSGVVPTAINRSKEEVHGNVPASSSTSASFFEFGLTAQLGVVVNKKIRTEGCVNSVSTCGSEFKVTLLRLFAGMSDVRRGRVTERRGMDFKRSPACAVFPAIIAVEW
jgi:hypothetical protein